jgi:hypothetical protein
MRLQVALLVLLSLHIPATLAQDAKLSPAYLVGKWSFGGSEGCASSDYALLRENGTLELGAGKTAGMAGFWELSNDTITLHMLVKPRSVLTQHPLYQDSYYYQYRSAQVLNTRPDTFDINVGVPQAAGTQYTLTRCR